MRERRRRSCKQALLDVAVRLLALFTTTQTNLAILRQTVSLSNADKVRIGNTSTAATEVVSTPLAILLQQSSVTTSRHWRARPSLCALVWPASTCRVGSSCLDMAFTGPSRDPQAYILLLTHGAHPVPPLITDWWYTGRCCPLQKASTPRWIAVNVHCDPQLETASDYVDTTHSPIRPTPFNRGSFIPRQCRYD